MKKLYPQFLHWCHVHVIVLLLMGVCFCFAVFSYFQNCVLRLQEWPLVWNICIVIISSSRASYSYLISIGVGVLPTYDKLSSKNKNPVSFLLIYCHLFYFQTLATKGHLHSGDYEMARTLLEMPLQVTGSTLWLSLWVGCIWLQKIVLQVSCCRWQSCCE